VRGSWFVLALACSCAIAQPVLPPPPELDQAVAQNPIQVSDQTYISHPALDHIEAEYTEEALIAQLEGVVRLTVAENKEVKVARSLGLGLDENAVSAVEGLVEKANHPYGESRVDFVLPQKRSRWHLLSAKFLQPENANRPKFRSAKCPEGPGLEGGEAIDHAQVVAALGKTAWTVIAFDIDEKGIPGHFSGLAATDDMWIQQAIEFIREWRFSPAVLDGKTVTAHCQVGLAWGARNLDADKIDRVRASIESGVGFRPGSSK
jgi:hypothetical protein